MNWIREVDRNSLVPVYKQLVEHMLHALDGKILQVGDALPSINKICHELNLAPGTVIRAYEELKELGILQSKQGKGYFIQSELVAQKMRVLLLFDRMNNYKEVLYDSFLRNLKRDTEAHVFFHHYDVSRFDKLIRENTGKYSHFVVMPHFKENVSRILQKIPAQKLILIDNFIANLPGRPNAVYQDFENNVYGAIKKHRLAFKSYDKIWMSLSEGRFQFVPEGCLNGFENACREIGIDYGIVRKTSSDILTRKNAYIVFSDNELVHTIKTITKMGWELGSDIGLISYDDSPLKEVLCGGISTMTTDFKRMGVIAARMVNGTLRGQIPNHFSLIRRNSF